MFCLKISPTFLRILKGRGKEEFSHKRRKHVPREQELEGNPLSQSRLALSVPMTSNAGCPATGSVEEPEVGEMMARDRLASSAVPVGLDPQLVPCLPTASVPQKYLLFLHTSKVDTIQADS